jgi:hypothetical protein
VSLTTNTSATTRTPCALRYAVETFDTSTGATHAYIHGSDGGAGFGGGPGQGR